MIDTRWLQTIYQQWQQGQDSHGYRWKEFVDMAARISGSNADQTLKALEKCQWFIIKGD